MKNKLGDCFEVAGHMILDNKDFTLCHGIATGQGPIKGIKHWHAWCEKENIVHDFSNGKKIVMDKDLYYKIGKIKKVKRYTQKQAMKYMLKTQHYGPW